MKKYTVTIVVTHFHELTVVADDEESARDAAAREMEKSYWGVPQELVSNVKIYDIEEAE